jgi:uncharacterized protein (TIGR03435 family)
VCVAVAADQKLEFEVASVKPSQPDGPQYANFPLGPGDVYTPNGGHFTASGFPLAAYIWFAYRIQGNQQQSLLSQLPAWVTTERFDIQARTDGDPAKDTKPQMRLMMQSLLADRFKLAMHTETRQVPVFALVLSKPGKTGPRLQPHPDNSCPAAPKPDLIGGLFPNQCGGLLPMPHPPVFMNKFGARNVTMPFIANQLTAMGHLDRPVLDQTGLSGVFDFALEWVPEVTGPSPPGAEAQPDPSGPTFMEAVNDQLGLKLQSQKGPVDELVFDHVERPSEN